MEDTYEKVEGSPFWHKLDGKEGKRKQIDYHRHLIEWMKAMSEINVRKSVEITDQHLILQKFIRSYLDHLQSTKGAQFFNGPPWKNTLQPTGCDKWIHAQCDDKRKRAAKVYCENIHYIPYDTFLEQLKELYSQFPPNSRFVIDINNSSEFIIIVLSMIDPSILDRVIIMSSEFSKMLKKVEKYDTSISLYNEIKKNFRYQMDLWMEQTPQNEPLNMVFLDDMSYSCGQFLARQSSVISMLHDMIGAYLHHKSPKIIDAHYEYLNDTLTPAYGKILQRYLNLRIHVGFVYITEKGKDILEGSTPYEPFGQGHTIPIWGKYTYYLPNVIPSLRKTVGEEMFRAIGAYFGYPSQYSEGEIAPDSIVYFDHKIADAVSTMGLPLILGTTAPGKGNVNTINWNVLNHMDIRLPEDWVINYISNNTGKCNAVEPIIPVCMREDEQKTSFPHKYPKIVCPFPWYKKIGKESPNGNLSDSYKKLFPRLKLEGGKKTRGRRTRQIRRTRRTRRTHRRR